MVFSDIDVIQLYEWYANLERRLEGIIEIMPAAGEQELRDIATPRAIPIHYEACSIVDSVLRSLLPAKMTRPNGKTVTPKGANIYDYCRQLEAALHLKATRTIAMLPLPFLISPFSGWTPIYPHSIPWWNQYNKLKHNRLKWARSVSLLDTVEALCALHQLMTKVPEILGMSLRFGWIELAGHNPDLLLEGLPSRISPTMHDFLVYTKVFCTPLRNQTWTSVTEVRPAMFKNSRRIMHFLGRLME